MPSVEFSGTLTPDDTEQTLATVSTSRSLMLVVNLTGMVIGDRVVLRSKRKVLSADPSAYLFQEREFNDVQSGLAVLDPFVSPYQAVFTLERTAGVIASVPWSVESL